MSCKLNSMKAGDLDQYEGQGPEDFCNTELIGADQNHCAHFVCHALDLQIGRPLCGDMKFATRGKGATMRVNDVFNHCIIKGIFSHAGAIPAAVAGFSAFFLVATLQSNIQAATNNAIVMHDHPKKHIGIYLNGEVWNFSNGHFKVVRDKLTKFLSKMRGAYGSDTTFLYAYRQDI